MIAPRRFTPPVGLMGAPLAPTPVAFSEQSAQKLQGIDPTLAEILRETERRALGQGIKIEVSEGMRGPERQAQLVAAGKSQTQNSRHLTGNAVDINIRNPDGTPNWDFEAYAPVADIAKQVAAEMGASDLVWGGDWKTLKDGVHFQLGGSTGGGGSNITKSTRGSGAMQTGLLSMDEEPQTFGQRLKRDFKSGDLMDRIALAANSLRMDPDPNLAAMVQGRQQQRADKATSNRTAQWLMTQGRTDLAEALMTGAIDPKTAVATAMTPVPPPADNRTAMMQNYEYWLSQGKTPAEAQALVTASSGGSTTNINMADESQGALNKEFAKAEGVSLAAAMAQGPRASAALQDLTLLGEVLQYAPQDPVTGRLAELIPGVSSAGAAAQAIIKRVAPTLRAEGSGSTSDIEYKGMLQSLPSLQNYPEANAAILGMMKAKAAIDIERSRVVRDFANSGQTAQDAQAMRSRLNELDSRSIMTPDLQRVIGALSGVPAAAETSTGTGTTPAVPSGARTFNPQTGRLE